VVVGAECPLDVVRYSPRTSSAGSTSRASGRRAGLYWLRGRDTKLLADPSCQEVSDLGVAGDRGCVSGLRVAVDAVIGAFAP
jgi:hypothetical protein